MRGRQRGIGYAQMAFVLIVISAIAGAAWWIDSAISAYGKRERAAGKAEIMDLWKTEGLEAAREDVEATRRRQRIAAEGAKSLQAANARADQAEEQLRRKHHEQDSPAVTVDGCTQPADAPRPAVHFNWGWVYDYDAAWTGAAGEPVFGNRPDAAGPPAGMDAASPYGPEQVFDAHADNAAKCSKIRRQLNELEDTLDALEAAEDARLKGAAAAVP